MIDSGRNWELFGYDMRQAGGHFMAAWRDLLFGIDSPLRQRFDEPVRLHRESGSDCYQAGQPTQDVVTDCTAVLLPADLVLPKVLQLPLAVETELASVLELEVLSNSPFGRDDTGYGWTIVAREPDQLQVLLVIVSRSASMAHLGREHDVHDPLVHELWAEVDGQLVTIGGFGEIHRERRYRRRLVRSALMSGAAALLVLVMAGVAAGFKGAELSRLQSLAAEVEASSSRATEMKSALSSANNTIADYNRVVSTFADPRGEIARLTRLLDDDIYLQRLAFDGREITLRGLARDAASLMQLLSDQPEYTRVTAPRAIAKVARTEMEQFYIDIQMGEGGGQ